MRGRHWEDWWISARNFGLSSVSRASTEDLTLLWMVAHGGLLASTDAWRWDMLEVL